MYWKFFQFLEQKNINIHGICRVFSDKLVYPDLSISTIQFIKYLIFIKIWSLDYKYTSSMDSFFKKKQQVVVE